jgi:predicted phosphodiesterase
MSTDDNNDASSKRTQRNLSMAIASLVVLFAFIEFQGNLLPQPIHAQPGKFLIAPYVQLGRTGDARDMEIVWGSPDEKSKWRVTSSSAPGIWVESKPIEMEPVTLEGVPRFGMFHAPLKNITNGLNARYKVERDGKAVFESELQKLKLPNEPYRLAVMGDIGTGSQGQREIANKLYNAKPDMIMLAGDIVYAHGRLLEYLQSWFPIFNADRQSMLGVPLMRSTIMVAAPGNHDTAVGSKGDSRNLNTFPDAQAYFMLWKQPLNGPITSVLPPGTVPDQPNYPVVKGSELQKANFLSAAGKSYPRMNMFSFDYGNSHWTVMDANLYVNWKDQGLRDWVENDIKSSKQKWHFVLFHQPAFNTDSHHGGEQHMRIMADVFERTDVDIVFAGHVHNYQRTRPLSFTPSPPIPGQAAKGDTVEGTFKYDDTFDGVKNTNPAAPIYIITGCGGAHLTGGRRAADRASWAPYTAQMFSTYSFTQLDIHNERMVVQQVDSAGHVLDKFELTK